MASEEDSDHRGPLKIIWASPPAPLTAALKWDLALEIDQAAKSLAQSSWEYL